MNRRISALLLSLVLCAGGAFAVPPVASNQTVSVTQGGYIWFYLSLTDVDTWIFGSNITVEFLSEPLHGTAISYADLYGSGYNRHYIRYTASDVNFVGIDSFSWQANDDTGGTSAVATVTVLVTSNNIPIAKNTTNTVSNTALNYGVLLSRVHTDPGQDLTYEIVSGPFHGGGYQSGLYFYYSPQAGYVGDDYFTWRISDGFGWSELATATLIVTDPPPTPPILQIQTLLVQKNGSVAVTPLYTGGNGYTCSVLQAVGYNKGPLHGAVTKTNGVFVYRPQTNYCNGPLTYPPAFDPPGGMDYFTLKIVFSNATTNAVSEEVPCYINITDNLSTNADWSQWRHDELRSSQTPMSLPETLHLQWRRDFKTVANPWPVYPSAEYTRPVQLGKTLYVAMVANDSVTAYDTDTGAQKWRFYANGAVRRPPSAVVVGNATNVIFGSDDGYVYCLNGETGAEVWKFRAAPNSKKAMGFGRLGSIWPVNASPTIYDGKVYFVAGLWPSWGLFGYCLDAATGAVIWRNDGRMMGAGWTGAVSPPVFSYDHTRLYGASGIAQRWDLDVLTGEPEPIRWGHVAGDIEWNKMASSACKYLIDGNGWGISESQAITAGGRAITPGYMASLGANGTIISALAGDGKLFVVTLQGSIYCFGGSQVTPAIYTNTVTPLPVVNDVWTTNVQTMLGASTNAIRQGLALVWGVDNGRLVEELAKQATNLMIVVADPRPEKLLAIRQAMDAAGLSGARVSTVLGNPMDSGFAPYQAGLIASEDVTVAGYSNAAAFVKMLYRCTRPFGGEVWLPTSSGEHTALSNWAINHDLFVSTRVGGFTQMKRTGLPDEQLQLKPPFRLTAFNYIGAGSLDRTASILSRGVKGGRDIYTWLPMTATMTGYQPPPPVYNNTNAYYNWVMASTMMNTLYGRRELRKVAELQHSSRICASLNSSPRMRYDDLFLITGKWVGIAKQPETDMSSFWGAFNLPDRGGCGVNGTFAGHGVFTFAGAMTGCRCAPGSYDISGQIVSVPEEENEENWIEYRNDLSAAKVQEDPIRKIAINLGGAGDRYITSEEMLWTHHPPGTRYLESPGLVQVKYKGNAKRMYRHSALMDMSVPSTKGWVSASQVVGMDGLTIPLASPLLAQRVAAPPTLDGILDDACWSGTEQTDIPPVKLSTKRIGELTTNNYVKIRYDDTNLYVAGRIPEKIVNTRYYYGSGWLEVDYKLTVTLNSRERTGSDLQLTSCTLGKESVGLASNLWSEAFSTNDGCFAAEMVIPWASLEGAGLWKDQMIMNINLNGNAYTSYQEVQAGGHLYRKGCYGPVYIGSVVGVLSQAKPHTVKLYFAEMENKSAGQRVFDVKLQGNTVESDLDVAGVTGGQGRELIKTYNGVQIASALDIDFVKKAGEPMLSGVEIIAEYTTNGVNNAPVAVASADGVSGVAPLAVTLSAKSSYDPDGQIAKCVWETGDGRLAQGSTIQHVFAEPGVYKVYLLVVDNRGMTAATNLFVTVGEGAPSSFVSAIRSTGGDFSKISTWQAAISSDLTSPASRLFTVSTRGDYDATTDNGSTVTFTGGGSGTLKHIGVNNVAYITGCTGDIQAGPVTVNGHTFTVSSTGSQIYTAVAECYNDWPNGMIDTSALTGWITDPTHCVTIRAARGHEHRGKPKGTNGVYTGFAFCGNLDANRATQTRFERLILGGASGNSFTTGTNSSVNRVVGLLPAITGRPGSIFANSILKSISGYADIVLHCTAISSLTASYMASLTVNSLSPFTYPMYPETCRRSYCVSTNDTATNLDVWGCGNEGNLGNQTVKFVKAVSNDFHLALSDTGARGKGVPGLGPDIDGGERLGPTYDVGADQADAMGGEIPPAIDSPPVSLTVNEWQPAEFSVSASGTTPLRFQWWTNGVDIVGATNDIYTITRTTFDDSGKQFQVVISNDYGSVTSAVVSLTVIDGIAPSITSQPVSVIANELEPVTFSVGVSGTTPVIYQWRTNGVNIAGATNATYAISSVPLAYNGRLFSVAVSNLYGNDLSAEVSLTVNVGVAPAITVQPANQDVDSGQTATFNVTATGTLPLKYQWRMDDLNIANATNTSHSTAPTVGADDGKRLRVVVSNRYGVAVSDEALLSVTVVNQPPVVEAGNNHSIQITDPAVMAATVTDDAFAGTSLTLTWSVASGPGTATFSPNANVEDPSVTFSTNGSYVLQLVASDSLLSATDTVTVAVKTVRLVAYDGSAQYTTIKAAIVAANDGDVIRVVKSPHTEAGVTVTNRAGLIIEGSTGNAGDTIVQASNTYNVASTRVFDVRTNCIIRNMTIQYGRLGTGTQYGSGIYVNNGQLLLSNSVVTLNKNGGTTGGGGGIAAAGSAAKLVVVDTEISDNTALAGGGLAVTAAGPSVSLINTLIYGNSASNSGGGASLYQATWPTMVNCTFTSNTVMSTSGKGGGLYMSALSSMPTSTVMNCTITGNSCLGEGGQGGGVWHGGNGAGRMLMKSTIVAGNFAVNSTNGPDFYTTNPSGLYQEQNNLIGMTNGLSTNFAVGLPNANGSYVGTMSAPVDAKLMPLADNGGPTWTCALASDSLAINHGSNPLGLATDQRGSGYARVVDGVADIGAYEYGEQAPVNQVPTANAGSDLTVTWPATSTNLDGTVTDDGLPGGVTNAQWSVVIGPRDVVFGNSNLVDTTASFSTGGVYVLRLVATDTALSATDTVTVTVYGVDGSGIPDEWKLQNFGSLDATNSGAADDYDKDGMNNEGEYRCGTHPTNDLSVLKLTGLSALSSSNPVLRWLSVTGVTYMIEGSTNLLMGFPMMMESNIPASLDGVNVRTVDVQNVKSVFLRIGVE